VNRPIVTGTSGGTKLRPVRRAMDDQDTIVVMLDPMGGFAGVSDALDGEQIRWVMTFFGAVFEALFR